MVNGTRGTYGSGTTRFTAPLLWPSSCADLLKVITNSTFIWGVTGPREDLNTVVVLFTYRRRLSGGSRISQRRVLSAHSARENFRATPICALATPTLIKDAQLLILCIVLDVCQSTSIRSVSLVGKLKPESFCS